ncbi:MAG: NADH-quinone oxidoreductase subunit D [Candidatus Micrarchaeia archaeon]
MTITRINVGPVHPSTHGVLRLVVEVDGDTIKGVEPHIGFLHRGVEKLMENRMYMQSPPYIEKLDYVAPLSWDDLYVAAVEQALGVEIKEYAGQIMTVLLEFQRIASHLLWLGSFANDIGQFFTLFMWAFRERAKVLKLLEDVTGSRMFYVNRRVGGLNRGITPDFKERAYDIVDYLEKNIRSYTKLLDADPIFMERTKGVGVLSRSEAVEYGVSGPVLRGSGVAHDVRLFSPYYAYGAVHFEVPTGLHGDAYDRYKVRFKEMLESISIIRQVLIVMPESGDAIGMPVRLIGPAAKPEEVIARRELPRGEGIIYMVPDKQKPYRISLRSPTFINLSVLPHIAVGEKFADLFAILGSLDMVMAEIDR